MHVEEHRQQANPRKHLRTEEPCFADFSWLETRAVPVRVLQDHPRAAQLYEARSLGTPSITPRYRFSRVESVVVMSSKIVFPTTLIGPSAEPQYPNLINDEPWICSENLDKIPTLLLHEQ